METFSIDTPKVTRDQALELMVYHLQLAAAYFEAAPGKCAGVEQEMERIMRLNDSRKIDDIPALMAAKLWLRSIELHYILMKEYD